MKKIFAIFILVPAISFACDDSLSVEDMAACADSASIRAEKELGKTYRRINISFKDDSAFIKHFHEQERLWLKFKEYECTPPNGNVTNYGLFTTKLCLSEARMARAKELNKMYK